ncbi:hypothetical protein EXIGLDRAFT_843248 [Exidia glandulosa HHB12029]|uniref:Uncharacterized protein n=1 Tax=Exidia glandulosa HHB12029 TaxID=1314781 RepID=A0A165CT27_EXIGL|nr:hypothetical protein EXIGLDRAFT_843248 [Exidia glandulosa HHB12029]
MSAPIPSAMRSPSQMRRMTTSGQRVFDITALPSFSHSLDQFPSMSVVDPAMLHWGGCEPTREANQKKFVQVLQRSSIVIASSSDEEDDAPINRLRLTPIHQNFPPTTDRLMAGDLRQMSMPTLQTRSSSGSSSASSALPTPPERLVSEAYFCPLPGSSLSSSNTTPCPTPRTHRSQHTSPERAPAARRSGSIPRADKTKPKTKTKSVAAARTDSMFSFSSDTDSDEEYDHDDEA